MQKNAPKLSLGARQVVTEKPWRGTGRGWTEAEIGANLDLSLRPRHLPCSEGGRVPETLSQAIYKAQLLNCKRNSVNPYALKV